MIRGEHYSPLIPTTPQSTSPYTNYSMSLGGFLQMRKTSESGYPTDLNLLYNQTQPSLLVWSVSAGAPSSAPFQGLGYCMTFPHYYGVIQLAVKQHIASDIYIREYWAGSTNDWTAWKSIAVTST